MKIRIIVFAKAPVPGLVKTRLIPVLGSAAAASLAERMLFHALKEASTAHPEAVELCASPAFAEWPQLSMPLPSTIIHSLQGEGDLGERLARASQRALEECDAVMLMGTDCPTLTAALLTEAAESLKTHDTVLVPALDGGYTLLGLRSFHPSLFSAMPWSTDAVADITRSRIAELNWSLAEFPALADIDEAADLVHAPSEWNIGLP